VSVVWDQTRGKFGMIYREIMVINFDNHVEHVNALCG